MIIDVILKLMLIKDESIAATAKIRILKISAGMKSSSGTSASPQNDHGKNGT